MNNTRRSSGGWEYALILLVTVIAYLPAMRGGFVFDDLTLIQNNPLVKASDGLHRFWFTTEAPDYYPLTESLWWLEWRLWKDHPLGYHVVNVLLQAVNVILLWSVLRRLKIPGALVTALVFAVHPVNVATVAWISEQKNTLSMLFFLAAILLYWRFDEEGREWRWYGLSALAFLLALLSKTAVAMLPVVLLGCVWWRRGRLRWRDFLYSLPFFVLGLGLALVTIWFQSHRALQGLAITTPGFLFRLAVAGRVPWFYLWKTVLPIDLMVIYPRWNIDATRLVSYIPGILLAGSFGVFWWKRKTWGRAALFGLGYFVVMLFPVLGFFNQGFYRYSFVADHWQYHAMVGVIALIVAGAEGPCRRVGRYSAIVAAITVVIVLTTATWRQSFVYADDATLWRDNVARNPEAWLAQNNVGVYLQQSGEPTEAMRHWKEALRAKPDYADAHYNLGLALWKTGRTGEAVAHWEAAVRFQPGLAEAHDKLGVARWQSGRKAEAMEEWRQAVQSKPGYADAHFHLGSALEQMGRVPEAIAQYEQALVLNPDYVEARYDLGSALYRAGQVSEAVEQFAQAVRIRPNDPQAHYNFGVVLEQTGQRKEAIGQYEEALSLKPDYTEAQSRLARARSSQ